MFSKCRFNIMLLATLLAVPVTAASDIVVSQAWSPEAPPVASVMAGYMILKNTGNKMITIESANSDLFDKVEIHRTEMKNGMMTMQQQSHLPLPAGKTVTFKAGGLHLMLIGKRQPLQAGDHIPLTLRFSNQQKLTVLLPVKKPDNNTMHHHHH